MINFETIYEYAKKPQLFEKSTSSLWDDEHISKGMLEAHLTPDTEAASRTHEFINQSVNWISEYVSLHKGAKVLDLGCGPGLYTERLANLGFDVTGIDFSKRSIKYAKTNAVENNLDIRYIYDNYLNLDYENEFDLIIMIYCDFGVLSDEDRDALLGKVYRALKPDGTFLFDVFTPNMMNRTTETKTWSIDNTGFWRPYPHLSLDAQFVYPEFDTFMRQHIVIDFEDKIEVYRNWDHTYSKKTIGEVLNRIGFNQLAYFNDVSGLIYSDDSDVMCVVAGKA